MPSERVQRRIDRLLDEAEEAADAKDWKQVRTTSLSVLAADAENEDAQTFLAMAVPHIDGPAEIDTADSSTAEITPIGDADTPSTFANGRYSVTRLLGEGGKKKVYLAHDAILDRDVAFAVIKTEGLDEVGRERIRREAQAMGRMGTHPCIMPIYDFGEEDGQPFMVQPLMGGGDVEQLIEDADGPLPLDQALQIATQTAQGLVFAHSKGIVHRDLKPGNIWLDDDGAAKIGDFGLAVATDRSRLTVEKMMVGTVNYMPPEQATGGEVTPRADLYSLGAMLYEMCTGRVPFMGDDDIAVIGQHVNTPPVAPSWHNPQIPKTLDSLIMRLLAKDPQERPESADEVLSALDAVDLSVTEESGDEKEARLLDSMAGGVFVGRHREMDQMKAAFEEVLSGKGRMVTLVGEPGIGKTRTAQELATYASMPGVQVLWGRS
ncbi:MAG: serine/threonine-protein kinase PknK, partial [Chloroflexi bacterium]|nr:serine/threonine-protein kinase PknK [Chloroflexota bacterium]